MATKRGTDQDDLLFGGSGDDTLEGGLGSDVLEGGSGDDALYADTADTLALFHAGDRLIHGYNGSEASPNLLKGGSGDDALYGANGNDRLLGGTGHDLISAAAGADRVDGGSGDDFIHAQFDRGDSIDGGAGHDTAAGGVAWTPSLDLDFSVSGNTARLAGAGEVLVSFRNVETYILNTHEGNDHLEGTGARRVEFDAGAGHDTLIGSAGDDRLAGGTGDDTLAGGTGDDTILHSGGTSTVDAGPGNDQVRLHAIDNGVTAVVATVRLGSGADRLEVHGTGGTATVQVDGGSGHDTLEVDWSSTSGRVIASLGSVTGSDLSVSATRIQSLDISAGSGHDRLTGGDSADRLDAGTGRDVVRGRGGNDTLSIGDGGRADGGTGIDRINLDLHASSAGVEFRFSSATVAPNATTSFTAMESLGFRGGTGNDTVTASSRADTLADGAGDDVLTAGAGNDTFVRGAVDTAATWDEVLAGYENPPDSGVDRFDGGAGRDTLTFATRAMPIDFMAWSPVVFGQVVVDLQTQSLNSGLAQGLTLRSIERIDSGVSDDTLRGSAAGEEFHAGDGNDTVNGRRGNDRIEGGRGADDLTGGAGRDTFAYNDLWFSPIKGYGYGVPEDNSGDRIRDFTRGQDKLAFDMDKPAGAVIATGTDPDGAARGAPFYFNTSTHELWMRYDGDYFDTFYNAPENLVFRVAVLDNVSTLGASDLVFV